MLLWYRLFACLWCITVAAIQFWDKGFFVLKYYTVWYVLYIAVGTTLSDRAACQGKRLPNPFGLPFVAEPWLIRKDVLQELLPLNFIFCFGYTV